MNYAIIVSYHHPDNTKTLVNTLHQYDAALEVVVVDNKSEEELRQWAETEAHLRYLASTNVGYGRAINTAIGVLTIQENDTVLVCNDDIQMDVDSLAALDAAFTQLQTHDKVIGPIVPQYTCSNKAYADRYTQYVGEALDGVSQIDFSPAACWLLNGKLLEQVGGFDPYFYMYGEDLDYMLRCNKAKVKAFQATKAKVQHDFHYPPDSWKLAVEKDKNTFAARMLNGQRTYFPMIRTWLGRIFRFDFIGGFVVLRGHGKYVSTLPALRRNRKSRGEWVVRRYL